MTVWYPIAAMTKAHVPVVVSGTGYELIAEIRKHPGLSTPSRPIWYWWEIRRSGRNVQLAPVGSEDHAKAPRYFTPLNPAAWPYALPSPVETLSPPEPNRQPPEPEDDTETGDGWPYPGLKLGCLVPPQSLKECEARLLRAIRTERSPAVEGLGLRRHAYSADIPREMAQIAMRFAAAERLRDGDDSASHEAVRSAWTPDRRDITDWVYCFTWLRGLRWQQRMILTLRAIDPPMSYTIIGGFKEIKLHPESVRLVYVGAVEKVYRRARR